MKEFAKMLMVLESNINPQPLGSESSTLSLIWNGSGWYGFIGAILASTTDISPVVHLHAIGNIHMRV